MLCYFSIEILRKIKVELLGYNYLEWFVEKYLFVFLLLLFDFREFLMVVI